MDAAAQVRHRLSSFPLYREQHHVHAICRDGSVYIGYRTKPGLPIHSTHFDAQVTNGTFYVLHIELGKSQRGFGYGASLYGILEQLAQDFDCSRIEMTPSGWTARKESRADYLKRKFGYTLEGGVAFKTLEPTRNKNETGIQ